MAPPAKADIATAVLTNVIEHLVWLFAPQQARLHCKAVWADFLLFSLLLSSMKKNSLLIVVITTIWLNKISIIYSRNNYIPGIRTRFCENDLNIPICMRF